MSSPQWAWIAFFLLILFATSIHWHGDSDGGGPCAVMGFALLLLMLFGTALESFTTKRRDPTGRGFDPLMPYDDTDHPPKEDRD